MKSVSLFVFLLLLHLLVSSSNSFRVDLFNGEYYLELHDSILENENYMFIAFVVCLFNITLPSDCLAV